MHIGSQGDCNTLLYHSNASGIQHVFCTNEQIDTQFCINLGIPHSKDRISACSDMLMQWTWSVSLPLLQWVSHRGLIGEADTARSSQGHLVSSNWPVWADQPTVHHSVWEDHFHSYHTPQHTFLLTIRHHRPGSGAGILCKASRSYTKLTNPQYTIQ